MEVYLHRKEQVKLLNIFLSQRVPRKTAWSIISTLTHWEKHHGIRWVVARLKDMRASLLSQKKVGGISYHTDGCFKGPFKYISILASRDRHGSVIADRLVRIYGRWEAPAITAEDYDNFVKTVQIPDDSDPTVPLQVPSWMKRKAAQCAAKSDFDRQLPVSTAKRVPFLGKNEYDTSAEEHYAILAEKCPNLVRLNRTLFDNVFEVNHFIDDPFGFGFLHDEGTSRQRQLAYDVAGKIGGLTKDRGLKKRFIANPHRLLQAGLSRLKDAANRTLQRMETSLVHDQTAAEAFLVDKFQSGEVGYSLDLSSATDHFPFWYQRRVAEILFPSLRDDIQLWADTTCCLWEIPIKTEKDLEVLDYGPKIPTPWLIPDESKYVTYTKGQPMGTNPSFAIFTLSHIVLLFSIGARRDDFRVIGDDVVIFNHDLAHRYMECIERLGVKISLTKSLIKSQRSEFAGRIADKFGFWPTFKASPIDPYKDPLGVFRQYGLKGSDLLPAKYRERLLLFAQLPLIGPKHCVNKKILQQLTPDQVLTIYSEPLGTKSYVPRRLVDQFKGYQGRSKSGKTVWTKTDPLLDLFESTLSEEEGSKMVVRDDSLEFDHTLVDHVNALGLRIKQYEANRSVLYDKLSELIPDSGSTPDLGMGIKRPISYFNKLWRKLQKVRND